MEKDIRIRKFPLKLDLQTFAGDPPADPPADPPQDPPADPPQGKKFSQEELDNIVKDRVAKADKAMAKKLGFDSIEAMQEALKKPTKKKPAKKDEDLEDEPDVDALVDARLAEKLAEQDKKTLKRLLTAEVKVLSSNAEAADIHFTDWEDALSLADFTEVKEDEKGNLVGVKEALEALAKKKPHLLKKSQGGGAFGANIQRQSGQTKDAKESLIKQAQSRGAAVQQSSVNDPWNNTK